ncbi:NADH-FMN oxidoreductase RutF, flavin reductase (DIM6/NTAB) family [Roseomonas rosea]|uniref:NADH-FMN oxidoreductase RutF, flavin reductase (DIM6/NTAB) family n=1 Tax=Muricoccus roseus TaxID=198092 RepID=A0A1M6RCE7_9PROT|nr:flavin reductase family protein [Roseomonas rosea]SHK30123.1 NADH-FMN oxidoreductase RutF, flavin reductase (DIM6/NTAB) family [Roseomonas rosea]
MLFDFEALPKKDRYKLVVSSIVPRPIAWMVTQDAEGRTNAAPFSFFNVFSNDPVVVGIGVGARGMGGEERAEMKDTMANIRATEEFTVCMVSEDTAEAMNVTAADFPPGVDELRMAGLTTAPGTKIKVPRIAESPVALECRLWQAVPIGTHHLVLGEVLAVHIRDDCMLDPARLYVDTPKLKLVGRMHGGGWYARTTDRFELPRVTPEEVAAQRNG